MTARKNAIVTGASKGLGALIAKALDHSGYYVADFSRTSKSAVDIRNPEEVKRSVKSLVGKVGNVNVLVNNAGYVHPLGSLSETTDKVLLDSFQTNAFGPFFMMRAVIPIMKKQRQGMIINIASKSAIYTVPKLGAYSASKAALVSLTEAAAKELRDTNVVCLAVCPSGMRSNMRTATYGKTDADAQQSPERVANLVGEIVINSTANGVPVTQGACVIIRKDDVEVREMQDG